MDSVGVKIVHTAKLTTHSDGPVDRCRLDLEYTFNLIKQFNGVANIPIHLVNKGQNRCIPQTAHIHQLDGALLHAFGAVNHHQ